MMATVQAVQSDLAHKRLPPRVHPAIRDFLNDKALVHQLVEGLGSPLNVMFPDHVDDNIRDFQAVYKKHALRGTIYFTSKPCKSRAIVRRASLHDIGADVSSVGSLQHVMAGGFAPSRIEATGPKNAEYLLACLQMDVLINADSLSELRQIIELHARLGLGRKARILVRLADYGAARVRFTSQEDTTFGVPAAEIDALFELLLAQTAVLDFKGFAYHASMASDEQRIAALEHQLQMTFVAIKKGLSPSGINIGGGFPIMYADSCKQWSIYVNAIKQGVLGQAEAQVWNDNGLGFRLQDGALRGGAAFINHAPIDTKGEELERWLNFRLPSFGHSRLVDIVRDSLLSLSIEPGRGMLDQCGITLSRVNTVKRSARGETLIALNMNRSNLHADHYKQLTEPLIVPRGEGAANEAGEGVFYVGNLCLSYDMIQYNRTYPDILPQPGDLVAFANTAAYMMDFTESETLMQPLARKVAMTRAGDAWRWTLDEQYNPLESAL